MGARKALKESLTERLRRYSREYAKRTYRKRREAAVQALAEIKGVPCEDCGKSFPPCAMDALLPGRKYRVTAQSPDAIRRDLADAEIVCANCGRERAYRTKWSLYKHEIK
jgi:RNase P subunit RPR2